MSHAVQFEDLQRVAADASISLGARAILLYALTRDPGYRATVADLVVMGCVAPNTVYARLKELAAAGYVTRKLVQRGCEYTVHATPVEVEVIA